MLRMFVAAVLVLTLAPAAQADPGLRLCIGSDWYMPVDGPTTWEATGGVHLPPLATEVTVTGDWDLPRWGALSARASAYGFSAGWSLVWDVTDLTLDALRYAQAETELIAGSISGRWVWAWADPEGTGQLNFGAWGRVGWKADQPAGWAIAADFGSTPDELELLGPGRSYTGPFTPVGQQWLLLHGVTLSLWQPSWKAEALFSIPTGLEEIRLTNEVALGIFRLNTEHLYTPQGSSLTIDPGLWLGAGSLTLHSSLAWDPPLLITGFRLLGLTLRCRLGDAWAEVIVDLGDHKLVPEPHNVRSSLSVPVAQGTEFSLTTWFGGPDTLWGWARADISLRAYVNGFLSLRTGVEIDTEGLLAWEAGFELCLGSGQ